MKKNVIVFGATGGTGTELVKQALSKNYHVTAFVRTPSKMKIADENLSIIQGDVLKYQDVLKALENQEVVFCTLGMPASDKSTLRRDGTANILKAMDEKGIKRFVCQTSLGFNGSEALLPWHMKYIIVPFILKNAFKDHELQEHVIEKSNTDWTIVRPGNMTNGKMTASYQHGFSSDAKIKLKVSRADVAHFMLDQVDSGAYLQKKAGISY